MASQPKQAKIIKICIKRRLEAVQMGSRASGRIYSGDITEVRTENSFAAGDLAVGADPYIHVASAAHRNQKKDENFGRQLACWVMSE